MLSFCRFLVGFSKIALPAFALYLGTFHSAHIAKHASKVIPLVVLMVIIEIFVLRNDQKNSEAG